MANQCNQGMRLSLFTIFVVILVASLLGLNVMLMLQVELYELKLHVNAVCSWIIILKG